MSNDSESRVPPHRVLTRHYDSEPARRPYIDRLFDASAPHYDWINSVLSFGSGRRYRRDALSRAGVGPGMRVLDVGCGTGVISELACALTGADGFVVAVDPSAGMLAEATRARVDHAVQGVGERLPFVDDCFDRLIMGYALRHVADLRATFEEYRRVLRPGGRVLLLEITRPENRCGYYPLKAYLKYVIPTLTGVLRRSRDARTLMGYYWDTIEHCVEPQKILAALRDAGFSDVERHTELGIFSEYRATRRAAAPGEAASAPGQPQAGR